MTDPKSAEALAKQLDVKESGHPMSTDGPLVTLKPNAVLSDAAATLRAQAAEIERLRSELADGSFYKESDIDALQDRAEKAEAERDTAYARGIGDAYEKVARWHDRKSTEAMQALHCGSENHEYKDARWLSRFHHESAKEVRALAPDPEERQ